MKPMPDFPAETPKFIEELRQEPARRIRWDWNRAVPPEELNLRNGIFLQGDFPDPEGVLETVYSDFDRFLSGNRIAGQGVPLRIRLSGKLKGEDFACTVERGGILLDAGSAEGVRRGLYRMIALLRSREYPGLPLSPERVTRYWLKDRISRCFFSPIKRAPFFRDELLDDLEYYPDHYLSRLAESGVNGIWITLALKEMDDSPEGRRRFEKLNRNIRQCRRYGIRVWAFCIEPQGWSDANPLPGDAPELCGPGLYGRWNSFCPASERAEQWLHDAVYKLFRGAPGLGGMITISHGERVTSCLSCVSLYSDGKVPCGRNCGLTPAEIIRRVLAPMERGMREASPGARLISWLYMPHPDQTSEWIYQLPGGMPPDVVMMANFESGCRVRQLGKVRSGGDYWLSAAGPSERFCRLAEHRKPYPVGAKIQVGCSHECATVPFIPVPGQLYRKYRSMKALGVEHVLQCWYFGNFPGVMNDAAGLLATDGAVALDEETFLTELARPDWGRYASDIVRAWNTFAAAYEYYPLEIQFQYYGPIHDGAVWPLYCAPAGKRLPQSWKPYAEPAGDAIGECLGGHSLDECTALTGHLSAMWSDGVKQFATAAEAFQDDPDRRRDFSLVSALEIHFRSGHNILRFYALRRKWLDTGDRFYREAMRGILIEEIAQSSRLLQLCEEDSRLGYHSEAEVFKYYPEKLRWRMDELRQALAAGFPEERPREELHYPDVTYRSGRMSWRMYPEGEDLCFSVVCRNREYPNEVLRFFFADVDVAVYPWYDLTVRRDGTPPDDNIERQTFSRPRPGAVRDNRQIAAVVQDSAADEWHVMLRIPHAALDHAPEFRFGVQHDCAKLWGAVAPEDILENYPPGSFRQEDRLYLGFFSPEKLSLLTIRKDVRT